MDKENRIELIKILASVVLTAAAVVVFKLVTVQLWLKIAVFAAIFLITGAEVIISAVKKVLGGSYLDEEFLMSVASVGAFFIGEYVEAIAVMVLFTIGELLEERAVSKSRERISALSGMRAEVAHKVENGEETDVSPRELSVGDTIIVRPGEKVPTDATVIKGTTTVDARSITGEALPIPKGPNDEISGGTINIDGFVTASVTSLFSDSTGEKIIELVENSSFSKSKTEKFISKFATFYTPIVVALAVLIAVIPSLITGNWQQYVKSALVFLVVSCPCALVISVPMAFFAGVGNCSKKGLLVKGCDYLEKLAYVKTVAFDKTGTVTDGEFDVSFEKNIDVFTRNAVYTAEKRSNHPVAKAIAGYLESMGALETEIENFAEIPGKGVTFDAGGKSFSVGNRTLAKENSGSGNGSENDNADLVIARGNEVLFSLSVCDRIKKGARDAIEDMKRLGVTRTVILSGDSEPKVSDCAEACCVGEAFGKLTPKGKTEKLGALIKETRGTTVFVGDGINDAPVLALADVGVAMGGIGQDAAVEAADAVLMNDSLECLSEGIKTAQKTVVIAKENIIFAISVKIAVLILSVIGISPIWLAIFADVGVCLLAILNSVRLVNYGGKRIEK